MSRTERRPAWLPLSSMDLRLNKARLVCLVKGELERQFGHLWSFSDQEAYEILKKLVDR